MMHIISKTSFSQESMMKTHASSHRLFQGSLNGTHVGGIKECKFMVILRDFAHNSAWSLGWCHIMTPVFRLAPRHRNRGVRTPPTAGGVPCQAGDSLEIQQDSRGIFDRNIMPLGIKWNTYLLGGVHDLEGSPPPSRDSKDLSIAFQAAFHREKHMVFIGLSFCPGCNRHHKDDILFLGSGIPN